MKKIVEDTYKYDNVTVTYKNSTTDLDKKSYNPITIIICLVTIIIFVFSLYRTAAGLEQITFSGFLSYLQNIPEFSLSFNFTSFIISDSWGIFDFLRITINSFTTILGAVIYFATMIIQLISFVVYSLGFFFV